MKEKFTGGEWVADKPWRSNGYWHVSIESDEEFQVNIASIWDGANYDVEANAHLIAAAPDMYRMLDYLHSELSDVEETLDWSEIESLLAKARGE